MAVVEAACELKGLGDATHAAEVIHMHEGVMGRADIGLCPPQNVEDQWRYPNVTRKIECVLRQTKCGSSMPAGECEAGKDRLWSFVGALVAAGDRDDLDAFRRLLATNAFTWRHLCKLCMVGEVAAWWRC